MYTTQFSYKRNPAYRYTPHTLTPFGQKVGMKMPSSILQRLICYTAVWKVFPSEPSTSHTTVNSLHCKLYTTQRRMYAAKSSCSTMASSVQRMTIVNNKFRASNSVYSSWQHRRRDDRRRWFTTAVVWRQVEQEEHINIRTYFAFETWISPQRASGERSECGNESRMPNSVP